MRLFQDIDKYYTKENAESVLKLYRRYVNMAGEEYTPKVTATFSLEPKGSASGSNSQTESMVTRKVAAINELDAIAEAINRISDDYVRQVIVQKYCKKRRRLDKDIYLSLEYSESEFYRLQERGLLEFAECYRGGELLVFRKFLGDICK